MFKHALTHDVAYHSMLVQRRKELHRLIGLAIEELYAERLAEHYEVLAHHFSRAEDWARALDYLLRSAEKAAKTFANREAIAFYDHALEVAGRLGDAVSLQTRMGIHKTKAGLYMVLSDFERSRTEGERLLALARQVGDRATEATALAGMGMASSWAQDFDRALDEARRAIEVARTVDATPVIASGHHIIGSVHAVRGGRLDQAEEWVSRAVTSREVLAGVHGLVRNPATSEWMKWRYSTRLFAAFGDLWLARGDTAKAQESAHQCLELATRSNSRKYLVQGWRLQGEIVLARGQGDEAEPALRKALEIAEFIGNPPQLWRTHAALGRLHAESGRPEPAREADQAARRAIEAVKGRLQHPALRAGLAAAPLIQQVYELSRDQGVERPHFPRGLSRGQQVVGGGEIHARPGRCRVTQAGDPALAYPMTAPSDALETRRPYLARTPQP